MACDIGKANNGICHPRPAVATASPAFALQDTVCIVLADENLDDSKIRMNKARRVTGACKIPENQVHDIPTLYRTRHRYRSQLVQLGALGVHVKVVRKNLRVRLGDIISVHACG